MKDANLYNMMKEIRTDCRLAMDGIASSSMREYGMDYKLNFGLKTMQIKSIASKYKQSAELSKLLWAENTRELKILATLLYPLDLFTEEEANKWAQDITNQEIREQICMNLFQNLAFAQPISLEWSKSDNVNLRISGYWLLARLLLAKKSSNIISISQLSPGIWEDIASKDLFLRNASLLVLKHLIRQSKSIGNDILERIKNFSSSDSSLKHEAYNSLKFEYDFIWN